ncbi:Reverse transcriptase (RNA-dependent DNA polymerase) [Popillia japonica]|uniref:Reverse transcriptase (RNA-dependent DNA polymerase) n=1 Tax=Popillia japonica TaxID=7064 RepID=A0AAW1ICA9_POPJA
MGFVANTTIIYTDFTKASDPLDHTMLIAKRSSMGFVANTTDLIASYFDNRYCYMCHNSYQSHIYTASSGVPQGSNLGPLLFNIQFEIASGSVVAKLIPVFVIYNDERKTKLIPVFVIYNDERKRERMSEKIALLKDATAPHNQGGLIFKLLGCRLALLKDATAPHNQGGLIFKLLGCRFNRYIYRSKRIN